MRRRRKMTRARGAVLSVAVLLPALAVGTGTQTITTAAASGTRLISASGTARLVGSPAGSDTVGNPEIRAGEAGKTVAPYKGQIVDGATGGAGNAKATANRNLKLSFDGLNHRQNRLANGGNQFSLEPPDQGLCEGNGFVVETINDVTRVYDTSGNALTPPTALNSFFGYPAAVNRSLPNGSDDKFGQFVTDPACLFDHATQRWFMDVLTIEVDDVTGGFLGPNHLDLAVSNTSDPTGAWTIYRTPVQDDGTQGTPDHNCSGGGAPGSPTGHGPCFGDFPHIGADANGLYLTTNEYSFFGPEFHGAQIYAFSKAQLVSLPGTISVTQIDTHNIFGGVFSGFTIWPATSPSGHDGQSEDGGRGVEYFMSSNSAGESHDTGNGIENPAPSKDIIVWALGNTRSLNGGSPSLHLKHTTVHVGVYAAPPPSDQKSGDTPLADCLNDVACSTFLIGAPDPFAPEVQYKLDSSDTRMMQVTYADGRLWGALDTTLTIKGVNKAAIEWFIVKPSTEDGHLSADVARRGYLGLAGNNLTYPAIGVTEDGQGVMAFTVAGKDHFPSAGYASINEEGVGKIHIAKEGVGPADGFSGYLAFGNPPGTNRPRWGDYGAAVPDGNSVWIASEYIGQTCNLAAYEGISPPGAFGSCGGTRTALANWDTRISKITVGDGE